jgi:tripartite-type tricarboxylate transporter receptor subunit TctC
MQQPRSILMRRQQGGQSVTIATTRRQFVLTAAAGPLLAHRALADDFPSRPIRIVVGFPPGGGIDILARLMAPKMSEQLGQPVIVENRPGANGQKATQSVAQSDADGYAILCGTMGALAVNQTLYAGRSGIDVEKEFVPLSQIASLPMVLCVNAALPVRSVAELIAYAKARPRQLFFGSSGIGGLPHLCGALFNQQAGVETVHVPYAGSAPSFTDLARGQVQFDFDALAVALPFIQGGHIRMLAATQATQLKALAGVPTMKETLADFSVANWYGMVMRAGTPPAAVARLNQVVLHALRQPDVGERADVLGLELVGTAAEVFGGFLHQEIARWAEVIRAAKIQVE